MKNKKIIIIITGALLIIILSIFVLFVLQKPNSSKKNNESVSQKQWDIENQKTLTEAAMRAYLQQDPKERYLERKKRLENYFTKDSDVYSKSLDNVQGEILNSKGEVINITECEEQEGGDLCLVVSTQITQNISSNKLYVSKNYWLNITKENGKFKISDLGILD